MLMADNPLAFSGDDIRFMRMALALAVRAYEQGEVPVGAVLVHDGKVIAEAYNLREQSKDPSAHAEMLVIRQGAGISDSWRLTGTTLYVTKEPCIMCSGAIVNSRIRRLVYGCPDEKAGGVDSLYRIPTDVRLNHRVEVVKGVLGEDCADLLRNFFRERR